LQLNKSIKIFIGKILCFLTSKQAVVIIFILASLPHAVYTAPLTDIPSSTIASPAIDKQLLAHASNHIDDTPHAVPRIHTEGTLPHQDIWEQSVLAKRDFPLMRDAAVAWRMTGDIRYAKQVDLFLEAWNDVYVPSFNPIDETDFDAFIEAYRLTRDALSPKTREDTKHFLRTLATGYIARIQTHSDSSKSPKSLTWINNWQSHRIKLIALSAAALEDKALMEQAHQLFLQQISNNISPDGTVEDFKTRDALHYVVYDLEPLTMSAIAAQTFDEDWFREKASNGVTLANAIDWLVPYADGTKTHEEFTHSHVVFDKKRATAGIAGFSGLWDPKNAGLLFWQVSQLDSYYVLLAQKLQPIEPNWLKF